MSRFDRFVAYSGAATIVYLIFFFGVLPLPGVSDEIQADVLPVVSCRLVPYNVQHSLHTHSVPCTSTDPVVVSCVIRIIPALASRLGHLQLQRCSRGVSRFDVGEYLTLGWEVALHTK